MRTRFGSQFTPRYHDPDQAETGGPFVYGQIEHDDGSAPTDRWCHVADLKAENRTDLDILADPHRTLPPAPDYLL